MSLLNIYNHFRIEIDHAEDIYIVATDGKRYIDAFSGIGVLSFGHSYGDLIRCMKKKMEKYTHLSNFFLDSDAEYVAERLVRFTGRRGKVFFSNSGSEAVEGVIKTIRKISVPSKNQIVFFSGAYHGKTTGALSVIGFEGLRDPFKPLLPDTVELPFNDVEAFDAYMKEAGGRTIAVFLEPVLGAGGVVPASGEFADAVMKAKRRYEFALFCDEIQTGLGRAGTIYCHQRYSLEPDLIAVAKSLGGGLPLGAIVFCGDYADILKHGDHGSTFAPNPVALAGARFVLDHIPDMLRSISEKSDYFFRRLRAMKTGVMRDVRGVGLMIGVELNGKYPSLRDKGVEKGLLLNILGDGTIRLLPPLNISYEKIDEMVDRLELVLCSLER